jgi:hypothetical protein
MVHPETTSVIARPQLGAVRGDTACPAPTLSGSPSIVDHSRRWRRRLVTALFRGDPQAAFDLRRPFIILS